MPRITMFRFISTIFKFSLINVIKFYKWGISPFLPHACRFKPTCSEYMIEAIEKFGLVYGVFLGIKRILRCHPWGGSGEDPVPLNRQRRDSSFFDKNTD